MDQFLICFRSPMDFLDFVALMVLTVPVLYLRGIL